MLSYLVFVFLVFKKVKTNLKKKKSQFDEILREFFLNRKKCRAKFIWFYFPSYSPCFTLFTFCCFHLPFSEIMWRTCILYWWFKVSAIYSGCRSTDVKFIIMLQPFKKKIKFFAKWLLPKKLTWMTKKKWENALAKRDMRFIFCLWIFCMFNFLCLILTLSF